MKNNHTKKISLENLHLDNPLFNFIHPNENDKFLDLHGDDLQHFLSLLETYLLEYRYKLGFHKRNTFGVEIEFKKKLLYHLISNTKVTSKINQNILNNAHPWCCINDGSLGKNGVEINSPIMHDSANYWHDLYHCCQYLNSIGYIDYLCGGHIHIGAHLFNNNPKIWLRFLKIWAIYENIIFRFTNGSYTNMRVGCYKYAEPISEKTWTKIRVLESRPTEPLEIQVKELLTECRQERYQAVNFQNTSFNSLKKYGNTLEFRGPNGSLDPIIWQNNINLMLNIINTCLFGDKIDDERLFMRWINLQNTTIKGIINYNEIYLDQALEFCDLIFDNNLDKIYFLRQYLKDFSIKNNGHFEKVPAFTETCAKSNKIKKLAK